MRRTLWGLAAGLALMGCKQTPAAADAAAPAPSPREACVDRWLEKRGLNPYGDPPDTTYAGGTPLFDERTGETRDRIEYVLGKHPAARQECAAPGEGR